MFDFLVASLAAILATYVPIELICTALLIRRLSRSPVDDAMNPAVRAVLAWSLAIAPTLMLALSTLFGSDWRDMRRLGWFGQFQEDRAGLATLLLWAPAAFVLLVALVRQAWLWRSKVVLLMIVTLTLICGWYTFAVLALDATDDALLEFNYWEVVWVWAPLLPMINLILLAAVIVRRGELRGRIWPIIPLWLMAGVATVYFKIYLARQQYLALPAEPPTDNCFVVGAAARGHPWLVGSRFNPATGRLENRQLARLRAFEHHLRVRRPHLHGRMRRIYNVVGPAVARRIRSRWLADATYLALKPAEWLATLIVAIRR